jgi:hypothetical protein
MWYPVDVVLARGLGIHDIRLISVVKKVVREIALRVSRFTLIVVIEFKRALKNKGSPNYIEGIILAHAAIAYKLNYR